MAHGEETGSAVKPKGTTVDVIIDDLLEIIQSAGMSFAQVSYDFSLRHSAYVQKLIRQGPEFGVTIWGRLPEKPQEVRALIELGIHFDAVLAEFAEDPEELAARFAMYDAARPDDRPALRGVIIESRRGIAMLQELLDQVHVDIVLPGPFDLSLELGLTPEHSEVQAEVLKVIEFCASRGVEVIASVSTHPGGPAGAAASPATQLVYPGVASTVALGWRFVDEEIARSASQRQAPLL